MAEITQEQRDELARKIIDIMGPFGGGAGPTFPPFPFPEFLGRVNIGKILKAVGAILIAIGEALDK